MELKDKTDVLVAQNRKFPVMFPSNQFFIQIEFTFVFRVHSRQYVEQGRLTAARFSHDRGKFSHINRKTDVFQDMKQHWFAKVLVDIFCL